MSEFPETSPVNDLESVTPDDLPVMRAPNGSENSPFSESGDELASSYFSSTYSTSEGYAEIYTENNVSDAYVQDIVSLINPPQTSLESSNAIKQAGYQVRVFVSKDDSFLREAFEKNEPKSDEICIFLEDNSTDVFSNASSYIKVGEKFRSDINRRIDIASDVSAGISQYDFENAANETDTGLNFSQAQIEELISTGQIRNVSREFLITLFQAVNFGTQILSSAYLLLGDGILSLTQSLRDISKFSDDSWDPQSEANVKKTPEQFEPALFPLSQELTALMALSGDLALNQAESTIRKSIRDHGNTAVSALTAAASLPGLSAVVPIELTQAIQAGAKKLDELLSYLLAKAKEILNAYIQIGTKWLNAVNAFLCGLWNAAVEAILGIVDLLGFLLKGLGHVGEAVNNAQSLVPQAQEMADELLQTLLSADIVGIAKAAFNAVIDNLSSASPLDLMGSISIERVSYYLGAAVGFVAEMAIGFGTGGTSSAASISSKLAKFGQAGESFAKFLLAGLKNIMKSAGTLIGKAILLVKSFMKLLKQGKQAVVDLINVVFNGVKKAAQLSAEAVQKIAKATGLDSAFIKSLDSLGFKVTNIGDDFCTLCAKAS